MQLRGWKKYGAGAAGMLVLVMALLLATGWGTAMAAQITSVFVTNDASHPVPVHEQGTANVNVTNSTLPVQEQGTVTTQAAIPNHAFSARTFTSNAFVSLDCAPDLPSGTKWLISSFGATSQSGSSDGTASVWLTFNSGGGIRMLDVAVKAGTTSQLTFPQPFVITSTENGECLAFLDDSGVEAIVVGYRQ